MADDDARRVPERRMLKTTLSHDQAISARKERRNEIRKKRKLEYLNEKRGPGDVYLVAVPQQQSLLPIVQTSSPILDYGQFVQQTFQQPQTFAVPTCPLPRQWSRQIISVDQPEKMQVGIFIMQTMNQIMTLMNSAPGSMTSDSIEQNVINLINSVVSRGDIIISIKNDLDIYGLAEPPIECLMVIHNIIKKCQYTNVNVWMFLAALLSGVRIAFQWFYELKDQNEIQTQYYNQLVDRTCHYVNNILIPDICSTIGVPNVSSVDHICAACTTLSYLCDNYQNDNDFVTVIAARSQALSRLSWILCCTCNNQVSNESGMFESVQWYAVMDQALKLVEWFGTLAKRCYEIDSKTIHENTTSDADDGVPAYYIAVKNYRDCKASTAAADLARSLASRFAEKKNLRTFHLALAMMKATLHDCAQINGREGTPDEYCHAVVDIIQTIPKTDKTLRDEFFDFLVMVTSAKFSSSGTRTYTEMYTAIIDVAENTSHVIGIDPAAASELGTKFDDIRWNLIADETGLSILSDFAKYPNLHRLAATKILFETSDKKSMLFGGLAPDLDTYLLVVSQLTASYAILIEPLRNRLKASPFKREITFQEVDRVCGISALSMIKDFVMIVTAFWKAILRQSNNPGFLNSITPLPESSIVVPIGQMQLTNQATAELRRKRCENHLDLLSNVIILYTSLLRDTSLKAVARCFSSLPNLEDLELTLNAVSRVIGMPTHDQEISKLIRSCVCRIPALKESWTKASAAINMMARGASPIPILM